MTNAQVLALTIARCDAVMAEQLEAAEILLIDLGASPTELENALNLARNGKSQSDCCLMIEPIRLFEKPVAQWQAHDSGFHHCGDEPDLTTRWRKHWRANRREERHRSPYLLPRPSPRRHPVALSYWHSSCALLLAMLQE
jgi:hypothetical protein